MTEKQKQHRQRRSDMAALTRKGWTVTKIAEKYGVTKQAVSLLLKKAANEGEIVVKTKSHFNKNEENKNVILVNRKRYKICKICNKKYEKFKNSTSKKTCSEKCQKELRIRKRGGKWSRYEFVNLTCYGCKKSFKRSNYIQSITAKRRKSNRHYCSHQCYLQYSSFAKTKTHLTSIN
jgi:hypothetical protein